MSVAKLWDDYWVAGEMPIELGASWLSTKAIKVAHQKSEGGNWGTLGCRNPRNTRTK